MRYLLDTNICIYIIKRHPASVLQRFEQIPVGEIAISSVTIFEMIYGAHKSQHTDKALQVLQDFLAPLIQLPFSPEDAQEAGIIRAELSRRG